MKSRLCLFTVGFAMILAASAWASDVGGKWTAQVPGRGGQTREATFNFKVDGEKLTGTVTGPQGDIPISDGKVKGDEISFTVTMSFGGNEAKMLYKGKASDDEIKFTRQREGGQPVEFSAKRAR